MRAPNLSAGVVVVRRTTGRRGRTDGSEYLVLRSYNHWDFPKGEVEPGEAPRATAEREAEEEASLRGLAFRWGERWQETEPYRGRGGLKVARYYLAEAPEDVEVHLPVSPELGRPEHHEFRWLPREQAAALLPPRLQSVLAWADRVIAGGDR
jgi:8-oxo-dGTP pyrophosphatase MutT (NUDIX family)